MQDRSQETDIQKDARRRFEAADHARLAALNGINRPVGTAVQISRRTWRVMDAQFNDIGRIRELPAGRVFVRAFGQSNIVTATLCDVQTDLSRGCDG